MKISVLETDVERVALNFSESNQQLLDNLTLKEAKEYLGEGHFPSGSMEPKNPDSHQLSRKRRKKADNNKPSEHRRCASRSKRNPYYFIMK
jgi:carbamate kinase